MEVNRGAPAAAVCGEVGGQHGDAQGRARGDLKLNGGKKEKKRKEKKKKEPQEVEEVGPEGSWGTPGGDGGRCGWKARCFFVWLPVSLLFYLPNCHLMNHKRKKCQKRPSIG